MKKSGRIVLVLSGALAAGFGINGCAKPGPVQESAAGSWDDPALADNDQDQANNSYVPGLGYYHSPYHAWYSFPFNFHRDDRGYYYGGSWHPGPYAGQVPPSSRPSTAGWMAARSVLRSSGGAGVGPGGFSGLAGSGSHAAGSVSRGGFGSSAAGHGSGGGE